MIRDATGFRDGDVVDFDLVVVGAGMAGIALAEQLRHTGRSICLLESGGEAAEVDSQQLYEGVNVGRNYFALDNCRVRALGGSSTRWGGWCRPLDPIDLASRDEIPLSGWPISYEELWPYYERASRIVGLDMDSFDLSKWRKRLPGLAQAQLPDLEAAVIQIQGFIDFSKLYRIPLQAAENVTAILHANVTELRIRPLSGRVDHAVVKHPGGGEFIVRGRTFVLATGGIENARLLLASNSDRSAGLGNQNDLVGRHFMETIQVQMGHLAITARQPNSYPYLARSVLHGTASYSVFVPTDEASRRRRLPTCALSLDPLCDVHGVQTFSDWSVSRGGLKGRVDQLQAAAVRHPGTKRYMEVSRDSYKLARRTARGFRDARRAEAAGQPHMYSLYARAEQVPNRLSRVTLDDSRDRLGMRRAKMDWRVSQLDLDAIAEWVDVLDGGLRARGTGGGLQLIPDWQDQILGGPHHKGTTRMATSDREGVVDSDCRVHGVSNLYVAGSSVFPTGGYANPSLTILAMTVRLADHLRGVIERQVVATFAAEVAIPAPPNPNPRDFADTNSVSAQKWYARNAGTAPRTRPSQAIRTAVRRRAERREASRPVGREV